MSERDHRITLRQINSVDYQLLWDAVQSDLPNLRATAEKMLSELERPPAT